MEASKVKCIQLTLTDSEKATYYEIVDFLYGFSKEDANPIMEFDFVFSDALLNEVIDRFTFAACHPRAPEKFKTFVRDLRRATKRGGISASLSEFCQEVQPALVMLKIGVEA